MGSIVSHKQCEDHSVFCIVDKWQCYCTILQTIYTFLFFKKGMKWIKHLIQQNLQHTVVAWQHRQFTKYAGEKFQCAFFLITAAVCVTMTMQTLQLLAATPLITDWRLTVQQCQGCRARCQWLQHCMWPITSMALHNLPHTNTMHHYSVKRQTTT